MIDRRSKIKDDKFLIRRQAMNLKKFIRRITKNLVNGGQKSRQLTNSSSSSKKVNDNFLVLDTNPDNNESVAATFVDFKIDGELAANIFINKDANLFELNTAGKANITRIGGGTGDERRVQINSDTLQILTPRTPASNSAGEPGQIAWDEDYLYVCTFINTWKRAALSTY